MDTTESRQMDKIIEVEIRNVYGNNLLYPVNETAKQFAKLLGVKIFNREQVAGMRALGYTVGQVMVEISV
jgi:hypothetical protein